MRVLAVDVGFGTSDVLLYDSEAHEENRTHLVVPSATQVVAREIREATRRGAPVVFTGPLMGGGPSTVAMLRHVEQGLPFYADPWAAKTFCDDLDEVARMGVRLIDPGEAAGLLRAGAVAVRSGDLRPGDLLAALSLLGEAKPLDGVAVAVQDHGEAPPGVSDRVFRFQKLAELLGDAKDLARLFFTAERIPTYFTRMRAAVSCVAGESLTRDLPCVVGDTGPAALWGAALTAGGAPCLAVNYGNGHTLMSLVTGARIDGLFEHHTGQLTPERMARHLRRFAAGELQNEEVLAEGGHGVLPVSAPFALGEVELRVTGPNRRRFAGSSPHEVEAALHGDMMITGCYGLLEGYLAAIGPDTAGAP
ncbi:MAG: DUF1786 domain-containing protein [Actinobacteria bacterium]|nr:DUF1786 domain-containing protein [Actinomycetota bacterium]